MGLILLGTGACVGVHQAAGTGVGPEWKSPLCTWTLYVKAGGQEAMCLHGVSCSACPNCEERGHNVGQGQAPDWLM